MIAIYSFSLDFITAARSSAKAALEVLRASARAQLCHCSIITVFLVFTKRFKGIHVLVRFRKVAVQRLGQVPEGCGAEIQVRFWKVPAQRLGQVPEGSGAEVRSGSGRFRCRG